MKRKIVRITTVPVSLSVLLKGQLKYIGQYYDVIAISSSGRELKDVEEREGVRTYSVEMSRSITPLKDLYNIFKLVGFFKKEKPYIVHSHTPKAGLVAMTAAFLTRVPNRIHTVAGLPLMEARGIKRLILLVVERFIYRFSTLVLPNSFGIRNYILEHKLAPESKLRVLGNGSSNGIDLNYFQPLDLVKEQAFQFKRIFNITSKFLFLFIGRLVSHKGVNELVSAFMTINAKFPDTMLVLVGKFEDDLDPVSELTQKRLLNNSIKQVGYQSDVRPFLAIADVFVFPSYREGFPNAVLQACAFNLPCIVSDICGCNEIIKNHENGIIVPPKNEEDLVQAMELLYVDKTLKNDLGARNRIRIKNEFEQGYVWNNILKLYDSF